MKLAGYAKMPFKNSFTVPIYTNGQDFFCHELDEKFFIKNFYQTISPTHAKYFMKVENMHEEYNIGSPGLFVFFATENEVFIETDMIKIIKYMNTVLKYELTKKEIMEVHEIIQSRQ